MKYTPMSCPRLWATAPPHGGKNEASDVTKAMLW